MSKLTDILPFITFITLLLVIWQFAYLCHFWPVWIFPGPLTVAKAMVNGFLNFSYFFAIIVSMKRLLVGFILSSFVGTILGFSIAKISVLNKTTRRLLLGIQTLPSICWLPLAILWFGLTENAILFVIFMGTFVSITISVEASVRSIPKSYIHAGRLLGAKGLYLYRFVIIPAILPSYITGLRQGWSFAWRSLISGEMLYISTGIGQILMLGRELNDIAQVIAAMIIILFLGIIVDSILFNSIEEYLHHRWGS